MNGHAEPAPVAAPLTFTRPIKILVVVAAIGILAILWRFAAGLGVSTALNDGYPWGLWIAFDVVVGTALACGGYALALLVYVLNKGQYHPLVRPALLAGALGYSMAGLSVALDLGRYWEIWKVPIFVWHWNFNSVLLEVAVCIMAYTLVQWIELSPAFLERARESSMPRLRAFATKSLPVLKRSMIWVIALGVLLPTEHQSSLGTLLMLSGHRMHPLWQTLILPLLFLTSCIPMGYATVVFEGILSSRLLHREPEVDMLGRLGAIVVRLQVLWVTIRIADVAIRGQLPRLVETSPYALLFWMEIALALAPAILFASRARRERPGTLFRGAMLLMAAGALYRFDVFLLAFRPGAQWSYFPSVGEIAVSAGIVAIEILAFVAIIHYFPIMSAEAARPAAAVERQALR